MPRHSRLILLTGKGGTGTTTLAAATALHAGASGLRTLLVSAGAGNGIADVLGLGPSGVTAFGTDSGRRPTTLPGSGLAVARLEPDGSSVVGAEPHLLAALAETGLAPMAAAELIGLPGVREFLVAAALAEQVRSGRWDLVVADAGPAPAALRLLSAGETIGQLVELLLPMEQRIDRLIGAHAPSHGGDAPQVDALVQAAEHLLTALATPSEVLRPPVASVRLVCGGGSVVLAETRRTWSAMTLYEVAVEQVLANQLAPDIPDPTLRRAEQEFAPVPVLRCARAAVEPIGPPALAALAAQLYGPPGPDAARRVLASVTQVEPLRIESDPAGGGGYTLRLPLPLVERSDLDLGRRGDNLVVSVAGARRVLRLPSALRRCEITGAALRSGSLSVGFRPDPALWPRP